jgi:hypothetical protein
MYWDKDARRIPVFSENRQISSRRRSDALDRAHRADDGRRTNYRESFKSLVLNRQIILESRLRWFFADLALGRTTIRM